MEKYEQIIKKQQQTYEPISKIQNREPDKKAEGKRQRKLDKQKRKQFK